MRLVSVPMLFVVSSTAFVHVACGGCPWVDSSAAVITPATPCLELEISKGDRHLPDGEGGCVSPIVFGTNTCSEALTFAAEDITAEQDIIVQPGQPFEVAIPLDSSMPDGKNYAFVVPAKLGAADLSIAFKTYAP